MIRPKESVQDGRAGGRFWRHQVPGWLLYLGVYSFHVLLFRNPKPDDFLRVLTAVAAGFGLTSLLRLLYRRTDVRTCSPGGLALRMAAGSLAAGPLWWLLVRFIRTVPREGVRGFLEGFMHGGWARLAYPIFLDTVVIVIWSALYFTVKLWLDWDQEKRRSESASRSAQATLFQSLRYQLNPHFLFNALNAVRALIGEDPGKAKRVITDLSEFLRYSLIHRDRPVVPLGREIEAIGQYLAIERIRYEDKLDVRMDVEPAAEGFPIIGFLVHPLVENAVRHGMRTSPLPLRVRVTVRTAGPGLGVTVWNSGRWIEPAAPPAGEDGPLNGAGGRLECIRRLLDSTCPGKYRLVHEEADGGVRMRLELDKRMDECDEKALQGAGR